MKFVATRSLALVLAATCLVQCKKEKTVAQDIELQTAPLPEVQAATAGSWELKRISGGICNFCEHPVTHHPYMILSANSVTFGNDSTGVTEQGPITWAPAIYFGNAMAFTTPSGNSYIPLDIRNDTLRLQQYASDGVTYHYVRK